MSAVPATSTELRVLGAAREIAARGKAIGLPMIATCADISSAWPVTASDGTPVAVLIEFTSDAREYWLQGDLALRAPSVTITRWSAEPFYYDRGVIGGWQQMRIAPELQRLRDSERAWLSADSHAGSARIPAGSSSWPRKRSFRRASSPSSR